MTSDQKRSRPRYWSIRSRLVTLVLVFGFVFTLIAVGVEYSLSYGREEARVRSAFDSIESGVLPALSLSVFEFDIEQIQALLKGITLFDEVGYVRLEERRQDTHTLLAAVGSRSSESAISRTYPLQYEYEGQIREVGRLVLAADMNAISKRIRNQVVGALITNGSLILLVSLFLLLLVQRMITRHLERTDRFVSAIEFPNDVPAQLVLDRNGLGSHFRDEIDEIVSALNEMTGRVAETYQELDAASENLTAVVSEREALIRELYHRTKNNMQVIMSMLSLKASRLPHEPVVSQLVSDMRERIYAMALVHEKLYKSNSLTQINMREYLEELTEYLMESNRHVDREVQKVVVVEEIDFVLDAAIACGVIVSELVSNSMKHAFSLDRAGSIRITLNTAPGGMMRLTVSDNGVGFPSDFDSRRRLSMGVETIYALGEEQLDGHVLFENEEGSKCEILFPMSACRVDS